MRTFGAVLAIWLACASGACARSGLELGAREDHSPGDDAPNDSGAVDDAGRDSGDDAGPPSGSLDALCGDYVETMCRFYSECFKETFRDHAQCVRELECYGVENLKDAVREGRVGYDAARARECFESLRATPCQLPVAGTLLNDAFGVDRLLTACGAVLDPHQGTGDDCRSSGECAFGHRCIDLNGCRCQRIPGWQTTCHDSGSCYHPQACLDGSCRLLAREGEPCASPLDCREDLDCAGGRCVMVERARVNEPCRLDLNGAKPARLCAEGLFCLLEMNLSGTCRPLAGAGERCVGDASCLPGHFCSNLFDLPYPVCHARGDVGAPCNQDPWCRDGLRCAGEIGADGRFATCSPPRALGEPCNIRDARGVCAEGLVCDGHRCLTALYDGESCDQTLAQCVRGSCRNGRCQGLARLGEPCVTFEDCQSRSCRSEKCEDRSVCSSE